MKKNNDIKKKTNSLKATSEEIAQYILDRIEGNDDGLYVPKIDVDTSKLKGLEYSNSIMFLCNSKINEEKKDMLVMIFPFAEVNEDNNGIISGFKLVYSTSKDINYADIALKEDTKLENKSSKIILGNYLIYDSVFYESYRISHYATDVTNNIINNYYIL